MCYYPGSPVTGDLCVNIMPAEARAVCVCVRACACVCELTCVSMAERGEDTGLVKSPENDESFWWICFLSARKYVCVRVLCVCVCVCLCVCACLKATVYKTHSSDISRYKYNSFNSQAVSIELFSSCG